jgi:hypothetical protein
MASSSSVHDLSLGEKLALKGQLFELRKKLNAIELQNQQTETYSFQPELVTDYYELPDRDVEFTTNVARAEMQRIHKLEMLKASIEDENAAELTFSPAISNKSRRMAERANARQGVDNNVGKRLYDQRRNIQENRDRKKDEVTQYDALTGQKLFTPLISSKSKVIVPTNNGDLSAHEFMYRDAVDREERLRQVEISNRQEAARAASSYKLNEQSDRILRRRAERETRALFEWLNSDGSGMLTLEQVVEGAEHLVNRGLLEVDVASGESHHKVAEQVWEVLMGVAIDGRHPYQATSEQDMFRTKGIEATPSEAEKKVGLTDQGISLQTFNAHGLPVMARAYLGAQFDRRALYESTISNSRSDKRKEIDETIYHESSGISLDMSSASTASSVPHTPPRSPYHVPRQVDSAKSAGESVTSTEKRKPHLVILKSDFPKSLISAKTAAVKVMKAPLGTTPTKAVNPHAAKQLTKSLDNKMDSSFSSAKGEQRPVNLDDIPVRGKIPKSATKNFVPVIANPNEATVSSSLAVFKTFMISLANLLKKYGEEFGDRVDLSRIRGKTYLAAERNASYAKDGGGTFKPSIPEKSKKLALSKEEREAADLIQHALEASDADAIANGEDHVQKKTKQNNLDMLLERTRLAKEKKEMNLRALHDEQMEQCTFKPHINKSPAQIKAMNKGAARIQASMSPNAAAAEPANDANESVESAPSESSIGLGQIYEYDSAIPAHERLYAMKDKAPRSARVVHKSREEIEFEGCTFAPKLAPYKSKQHMVEQEIQIDDDHTEIVSMPTKSVVRPTGWQQSIDRMRLAAAKRAEPIEEELQHEENLNIRYERSKRQFAAGPKEFSFQSDARIKERTAKENKVPRMYVDVKLSAHKTANIPVYDGDDPAELARGFCKIYAFPPQAYSVLEEVICQSMEANQMKIPEPSSESETEAALEAPLELDSEPDVMSTPDTLTENAVAIHSTSTSSNDVSISREDNVEANTKSYSKSSKGKIRLRTSQKKDRTTPRSSGN